MDNTEDCCSVCQTPRNGARGGYTFSAWVVGVRKTLQALIKIVEERNSPLHKNILREAKELVNTSIIYWPEKRDA